MPVFLEHTPRIQLNCPVFLGVVQVDSEKPEQGCPVEDFDFKAFMEFQCEEIRKHRYLESEKAGRDLGFCAELDWVSRFAKQVRDWAYHSDHFRKNDKQKSSKV
jgi:hypothetical protein